MPKQAPYLRVADDLRARLAAGDWAVGERLPGRGELGEHYGVSPSVVQRAQERLIIEGLLEGRSGSGTYVRTPRERLRMLRSHPAGQGQRGSVLDGLDALGPGLTWTARSEARVAAPPGAAARLAVGTGALTVHTRYVFLAEERPVQLTESWEPMDLTGETPVLLPEAGPLAGQGVVTRMRSIGVTVSRATETPRPSRAGQEQANLLGISVGDLVTRIERTYYDTTGRPVETADITVPDARWTITYDILVPH